MQILTPKAFKKMALLLAARTMFPNASSLTEAIDSLIQLLERSSMSLPDDPLKLQEDLNLLAELKSEAITNTVKLELHSNNLVGQSSRFIPSSNYTLPKYMEN